MKTLRLDEIDGVPVLGTLVWKPIRRPLGITAFGINAYTAANAGDEVVEDHSEKTNGHEEIYVVVSGHAVFTVDGREVDAPAGTLVYLDDPLEPRSAATPAAASGRRRTTTSPRSGTTRAFRASGALQRAARRSRRQRVPSAGREPHGCAAAAGLRRPCRRHTRTRRARRAPWR